MPKNHFKEAQEKDDISNFSLQLFENGKLIENKFEKIGPMLHALSLQQVELPAYLKS